MLRWPTFSIAQIAGATSLAALALAWSLDHRQLSGELAHFRNHSTQPWLRETLRAHIDSLDFDERSIPLYQALLNQDESFHSGLISYLGLDQYRGKFDPYVQRSVWWHQVVKVDKDRHYHCYFADRHRRVLSLDCSAYIVTDQAHKLVHWQGTRLDSYWVADVKTKDEQFPLSVYYVPAMLGGPDGVGRKLRLHMRGVEGPVQANQPFPSELSGATSPVNVVAAEAGERPLSQVPTNPRAPATPPDPAVAAGAVAPAKQALQVTQLIMADSGKGPLAER